MKIHRPQNLDWFKWYLAIAILVMGIVTRVVPALHPSSSQVFDESYFIPQVESYAVNRYYFDPHPPLAKEILYVGMMLFNPDAANKIDADKLANKVENYKDPLDMRGVRFFPEVFGVLVPVLAFLLVYELVNWQKKRNKLIGYLIPAVAGIMLVLENTFIVESRYALLSQIMIFFMFAAVFSSVKYYKAKRDLPWLILTAIFFGCAFATKWLGLAVAPAILMLILVKQLHYFGITSIKMGWRKFGRLLRRIAGEVVIISIVTLTIYLGAYAWHFNQIKYYSPAADEVVASYLDDLKNGTNNTSFLVKFFDAQRLISKYEEYVPKLDYTKSDEIGSMWITWPIMARPIDYYWETDGSGTYGFVFMFGNPAVWLLGLIGILGLTAIGFARLFGKNGFNWMHFTVVLLYFSNWLPYETISRVMYLYHYLPALFVSVLAFAVLCSDFILPRCRDLVQRWDYWEIHFGWPKRLQGFRAKFTQLKIKNIQLRSDVVRDWGILGFVLLILIFVVASFIYFMPLAYVMPLTKAEFTQRALLKEWNMKWPGN